MKNTENIKTPFDKVRLYKLVDNKVIKIDLHGVYPSVLKFLLHDKSIKGISIINY